MKAGANWLVIGRPITGAKSPKAAAVEILNSINPELVPESERPLPEAVDCSVCGQSIKLDKTNNFPASTTARTAKRKSSTSVGRLANRMQKYG